MDIFLDNISGTTWTAISDDWLSLQRLGARPKTTIVGNLRSTYRVVVAPDLNARCPLPPFPSFIIIIFFYSSSLNETRSVSGHHLVP